MSTSFRAWDVDQTWLLPPSVQEFLPAGHLAHFVRDTVREALDLSAIPGVYKGEQGQPPYHPGMLVALLLYGCFIAGYNGQVAVDAGHQIIVAQRLSTNPADDAALIPGPYSYRLRKQVVEPVFGQIKQARGFRQFLLRGLNKVRGEWAMICTAHNAPIDPTHYRSPTIPGQAPSA